MNKPTIPEVLDDFVSYYKQNLAWGSLHAVLDEGNHQDSSVQFCQEWALEQGDTEGYRLACILLRMSRTQRGRLSAKVYTKVQAEKQPSNPWSTGI
jgi:hypothetical protein